MAFGLCGISSDADSPVGGIAGHVFAGFYSHQSVLRVGSVGGVLGQADSLLHTGESSGKRYVWHVRKDGISESLGIQLPDTDGGRWIDSFVCGLEISSGWMYRWILGLMGCNCVDLDRVQSAD